MDAVQDRDIMPQIVLADLELEKVFSEVTSLECSAKGVDKGTGLGVAMGNSKPEVLEAADAVVSDNDHDGCAEAIRLMYE